MEFSDLHYTSCKAFLPEFADHWRNLVIPVSFSFACLVSRLQHVHVHMHVTIRIRDESLNTRTLGRAIPLSCVSLPLPLSLSLTRSLALGVARQRGGPISLGIAPRACTILNKLLLLILLLLSLTRPTGPSFPTAASPLHATASWSHLVRNCLACLRFRRKLLLLLLLLPLHYTTHLPTLQFPPRNLSLQILQRIRTQPPLLLLLNLFRLPSTLDTAATACWVWISSLRCRGRGPRRRGRGRGRRRRWRRRRKRGGEVAFG